MNYNYAVNTFVAVGKTKAAMTFGDIGVNANVTYTSTSIQLLLDNGATATLDIDGLGTVDATFTYATTDDGAPANGWYLMEDAGFEYPQNDRVLPLGQGYLVDVSDADAALVFAGAVSKDETEVELAMNYNFTGNCCPKDITFGDIVPNGNVTYTSTSIQLLEDNGATATLDIDGLGTVDATFTYATTDDGAPTNGWYLMEDAGFEYPQNSRVLKAGQGVLVDVSDFDATFTFPSAL